MKLSGRWFPHIVDSWNLYPIYIYIKIVVLASEPVGGRSRATELPCCLYATYRCPFVNQLCFSVPLYVSQTASTLHVQSIIWGGILFTTLLLLTFCAAGTGPVP